MQLEMSIFVNSLCTVCNCSIEKKYRYVHTVTIITCETVDIAGRMTTFYTSYNIVWSIMTLVHRSCTSDIETTTILTVF